MSRMRVVCALGVTLAALGVGACATAHKGKGRIPNGGSSVADKVGIGKDRLLRFEFAPGEVTQYCDAAMEEATVKLDEIAKIPANERTVENTLLAFEAATAELNDIAQPLTFMGYVSTDQKIHDEGQACEEKLGPYFVGLMSRRDLYNAIKDAKTRNPQEVRLLSETLRDFKKAGMDLSDENLAKVKALNEQLAVLQSQFSSNLNNDTSTVEYDANELEGVSPDFMKRLQKAPSGKLIVTTKTPDYTHVAENAKSGETRRKMYIAYLNRQADKNVKLLEQAVQLRQQIATIMGFKTWADYRTWGRMAKDADTVMSFLNGLKGKLAQRNRDDLAKLLKFKKELDPSAQKLDMWDINYLAYQLKKRDYSLDNEMIKEYFPAEKVIAGVFKIYEKLLGVRFQEVKDGKLWSTGVKLFEIHDAKDDHLIAHFYTDFFPRPLKYGHFAAFSLVLGHAAKDGSYQKPVSAMVGNFNPPSGDKPSLMDHQEVETFFHEFGHIMHQTLTKAPYASLSGSNTAQDFVEAPSQMLENWAWSPKILEHLSSHYKTGKPLPKKIIKKMIEAKDFNQGYFYTRQLMLGLTDMTYHISHGPVDTTAVYNNLYRELIGVEPLEGTHFQAGFGHLMGGYDAGYYGYLWSEVYAEDMFTRFAPHGLFKRDHLQDPKVGVQYRRTVLEKGRMVEALDLLREFLGREPNSEAFFKRLHIK